MQIAGLEHEMLDLVLRMPEDLEEAYSKYAAVIFPEKAGYQNPSKIVVMGLGGSAIGGLILSDYVYDRLSAPIIVTREFLAPHFLDDHTLVVAVSYSGNTEETLRSLKSAFKLTDSIVTITSDGFLEKTAKKYSLPTYVLPSGRPPRTALPQMMIALLWILEKSGLYKFPIEEAKEAISLLKELRKHYVANPEPLIELASKISESLPLVYSYWPYRHVGYRFKTQLNENAKIHAFWAPLPEANHNEIMGWEGGLQANYHPVIIRDEQEEDYLRYRIEYLKNLLRSRGISYSEVFTKGRTRLAKMFSTIFTLDLVSVILALKLGVDPLPVSTISGLKSYLSTRIDPKEYSEI